MKINKLLALSITAIALSGCSKVDSIKKPKTAVTRNEFIEAFEAEYNENPLFLIKKGSLAYGYTTESHEETYATEKTYQASNLLYTVKEKTVQSGESVYDNTNKILHSESSNYHSHESDQLNGEIEYKYDYTVFPNKSYVFTANNLNKTFSQEKVDDALETMEARAKSSASGMAALFLSIAKSDVWAKDDFYIDARTYTIVIERQEKDEVYTTRYQFKIENDGFHYRTDETRFENTENGTYEVESKSSYTLKKKDCSLKAPDISQYLGVEEFEEEDF